MLRFDHFLSAPLIGLDIQATEICFLQLRRVKQEISIEQAARISLPIGAIIDGKIQQFDVVSESVHKLVQQTKMRGCGTAIALPTQCVITKKIQLPRSLCESGIAKEITENLHSYFPNVTDALAYDFTVLYEADNPSDNVLVTATRYDQLTSYVGVIEQAGLKVKIVDVDIYALIRAIRFAIPDMANWEVMTLLNIGDIVTQLIVTHKNEIIFHQQFINGGIKDICIQIKCVLQMYFSNYKQLQIHRILLAGVVAGLTEITTYIYQELAIETQYINPFDLMSISSSVPAKQLLSNKLLVCCGLALRGIKPC